MSIKKIEQEVQSLYIGSYGITEPSEIDIEAIAFDRDAMIKRRPLSGCEAMIIGAGDKAIITVNETSQPQRQRFSIGHELGHWFKDRGKVGNLCSKQDMESPSGTKKYREIVANEYASQLLVPTYLLNPIIQNRPLDQVLLNDIVALFNISFMASVRRVIGSQLHMGFFAMYDSDGNRKLFKANDTLPIEFLPPRKCPQGSRTYELIYNGKEAGYGLVDGEVWCRVDRTNIGVVHEHAFHYHNEYYITLIWWEQDESIWKFIEEKEMYE